MRVPLCCCIVVIIVVVLCMCPFLNDSFRSPKYYRLVISAVCRLRKESQGFQVSWETSKFLPQKSNYKEKRERGGKKKEGRDDREKGGGE